MRMRNGDRFYPAQRGYQRFCRRVQIGNAVPQNIPLRGEQQKRALVDGKFRYRLDAQQLAAMLLPLIHMGANQSL